MAEVNITPLEDGDPATAASLNDQLLQLNNGVNALEDYSIEPGALRRDHLPAVAELLFTSSVGDGFTSHNWAKEWNQDSDGTATWDIIADGTGKDLSETGFAATVLGMDQANRFAGILVLLNNHFVISQAIEGAGFDPRAVIGIQVRQTGDVTWYTIQRATRICSVRGAGALGITGNYQDIAQRLTITTDDLDRIASIKGGPGATTSINGIRAVVAINSDLAFPGGIVTLREGRMSAFRLRASGLPDAV